MPVQHQPPRALSGHADNQPSALDGRAGQCSVGGDQELGGGQLGVPRVCAERFGVGLGWLLRVMPAPLARTT
jgi:hypothetical protein